MVGNAGSSGSGQNQHSNFRSIDNPELPCGLLTILDRIFVCLENSGVMLSLIKISSPDLLSRDCPKFSHDTKSSYFKKLAGLLPQFLTTLLCATEPAGPMNCPEKLLVQGS